jgi:hypothetical protein
MFEQMTNFHPFIGRKKLFVFLVMAFKKNEDWELLLASSFALICLWLAPASAWFRAFRGKIIARRKSETEASEE